MDGVPDPAAWLILVAAVLTAAITIWRKGILPLWRLASRLSADIQRIAEATPVLVDIAEEFQPNGGSTLRDTVDRIEANGKRLEDGVLEAIRIGHENSARLGESGDTASVLARLDVLERRQDRLIGGVLRLLTNSDAPLAKAAAQVIEEAVTGVEEVTD